MTLAVALAVDIVANLRVIFPVLVMLALLADVVSIATDFVSVVFSVLIFAVLYTMVADALFEVGGQQPKFFFNETSLRDSTLNYVS